MLPILRNARGRHPRRRSRDPRGGRRRRHDLAPAALPGGAAAGRAGDHGRRAHRRGLDHRARRRSPRRSARPASATTSSPACRPRTGSSCCSAARPRRRWRWSPTSCWAWSRPARARRSLRLVLAGAVGPGGRRRRWRVAPLARRLGKPATYVVGAKNFSEQYILAELMADRLEAAGARGQPQGGPGLGGRLPRAGGRRDRRLRRLFRHALDQRPEPQGQPRPRRGAEAAHRRAEAPRRRRWCWARWASRTPTPSPCGPTAPRRWASPPSPTWRARRRS